MSQVERFVVDFGEKLDCDESFDLLTQCLEATQQLKTLKLVNHTLSKVQTMYLLETIVKYSGSVKTLTNLRLHKSLDFSLD